MPPNLAQVLNTIAHEIRTPLAVSQGYLKLLVDGRVTNADEARRAMEQTRQALGALATLCMDMGKVSALADAAAGQVAPVMTPAADFIATLQTLDEVKGAAWDDTARPVEALAREGVGSPAIATANHRDLAHAVAIAIKAAFDENRDAPHTIAVDAGRELTLLAGTDAALAALRSGPAAPDARGVDFSKGGKGLKLIWAAFVLERHGVHTWVDAHHRASVGFRIPLVQA